MSGVVLAIVTRETQRLRSGVALHEGDAGDGEGRLRDTPHRLAVRPDLVPRVRERGVAARAAGEGVRAGPPGEDVVPRPAAQQVVARETEELVVAGVAVQLVGRGRAAQRVVARRATNRPRGGGPDHDPCDRRTRDTENGQWPMPAHESTLTGC